MSRFFMVHCVGMPDSLCIVLRAPQCTQTILRIDLEIAYQLNYMLVVSLAVSK